MFRRWIPVIVGSLIASAYANDEVLIHKRGIYKGAAGSSNRAELGNAMRAVVNSLSTPYPGNFGQFANNVATDVALDIRDTDMNGVDPTLAAWGLPAEVTNFLTNIKFSESVQYQTYKFVLKHNDFSLGEFVAAGRNDNGAISLAFIKVNARANAVQQYNVIRKCKKVLFRNKCHNENVPRAFTLGEIQVVQQGLMHHGFLKLAEKANTINMAAVEEIFGDVFEQTPKTDQDQLVDAIKGSIMVLKHNFEKRNRTSQVVRNISAPGYSSFVQEAVLQTINGLDGRFFGRWADMIVKRVASDNATKVQLQKYLDRIPEAQSGKWNMFRTIFSSTNSSSANYLCIMSYKTEAGKYKIYTIQLSNTFKLAQNVLVVRNSQSEDSLFTEQKESIETVPRDVTEEDVKGVLDFFDLIAFQKFMSQFGETIPKYMALN